MAAQAMTYYAVGPETIISTVERDVTAFSVSKATID